VAVSYDEDDMSRSKHIEEKSKVIIERPLPNNKTGSSELCNLIFDELTLKSYKHFNQNSVQLDSHFARHKGSYPSGRTPRQLHWPESSSCPSRHGQIELYGTSHTLHNAGRE
jgi:hypothetical protein